MRALAEFGDMVRTPLREAGLTKKEIRYIAKSCGLSAWGRPSSPCLATRIRTGLAITEERLRQIEVAEAFVAAYLPPSASLRVRCYGNLASIETDASTMGLLVAESVSKVLSQKIKELGFSFVMLDLTGFKSGSFSVRK
jgi:uncharacterized protein